MVSMQMGPSRGSISAACLQNRRQVHPAFHYSPLDFIIDRQVPGQWLRAAPTHLRAANIPWLKHLWVDAKGLTGISFALVHSKLNRQKLPTVLPFLARCTAGHARTPFAARQKQTVELHHSSIAVSNPIFVPRPSQIISRTTVAKLLVASVFVCRAATIRRETTAQVVVKKQRLTIYFLLQPLKYRWISAAELSPHVRFTSI